MVFGSVQSFYSVQTDLKFKNRIEFNSVSVLNIQSRTEPNKPNCLNKLFCKVQFYYGLLVDDVLFWTTFFDFYFIEDMKILYFD